MCTSHSRVQVTAKVKTVTIEGTITTSYRVSYHQLGQAAVLRQEAHFSCFSMWWYGEVGMRREKRACTQCGDCIRLETSRKVKGPNGYKHWKSNLATV